MPIRITNRLNHLNPITILLVDDRAAVRKAYRELLGYEADLEVVGDTRNGKLAVASVKKLHPDVVLLDLSLPLQSGIKWLRQIHHAAPDTKVLILSTMNEDLLIASAMSFGARGYLVKWAAANRVCQAIQEVSRGRIYFCPLVPKYFHQSVHQWNRTKAGMRWTSWSPEVTDLWRGGLGTA